MSTPIFTTPSEMPSAAATAGPNHHDSRQRDSQRGSANDTHGAPPLLLATKLFVVRAADFHPLLPFFMTCITRLTFLRKSNPGRVGWARRYGSCGKG